MNGNNREIRFIELFAGIGGFRLGLERADQFKCVWSNDIDRHASKCYREHWGGGTHFEGDIRSVDADSIPDHDLLTGGFPCQAFSVAGKRRGFADTRGTLFFEVARIAKAKQPKLLLLENVKGLLSHGGGKTFETILITLDELGYDVEWQVLDSQYFGVPQHRERVFIVGHLRGKPTSQIFPVFESDGEVSGGEARLMQIGTIGKDREATRVYDPAGTARTIKNGGGMGAKTGLYAVPVLTHDQLEKGRDKRQQEPWMKKPGDPAYTLLGQGVNGIAYPEVANTVTDGYLMDTHHHSEPMCRYRIRRLTPTECERLQGFADGWTSMLSDTQRYKCLGNAVTVNVIEFLGRKIKAMEGLAR